MNQRHVDNRVNLTERIAISGYDFQHLEFGEFLDLVKSWEVTQIELWPQNTPDQSVEQIEEILGAKNVSVICVNASVAFLLNKAADVAVVQSGIIDAIRKAARLRAPLVNIYLGSNPQRDSVTTVKLFRRNIQPCLEVARENGITVVLENHFDNRNEDPQGTDVARRAETLSFLVEAVDSSDFGLTYDPCNFYIAGDEPYPYAYQLLRPHIAYVHIKDATFYSELHHGVADQYKLLPDSIRGRYLPVSLADGAVNYEGILGALVADGYQGFLTIEPHTEQARVEQVGAANLAYLRTHLGE